MLPNDDTVAPFSAAGQISVSAPGVGIPVDAPLPGMGSDKVEVESVEGTTREGIG